MGDWKNEKEGMIMKIIKTISCHLWQPHLRNDRRKKEGYDSTNTAKPDKATLKSSIMFPVCFILLLLAGQISAQEENTGNVIVDSVQVKWKPAIDIQMRLNLSGLYVASGSSVEITPLLVGTQDTLELPRVLVNGRIRHLIYRRDKKKMDSKYSMSVQRHNGTEQHVDYTTSVIAEPWMDGADLIIITDLCECGWKHTEISNSLMVAQMEAPKYKAQVNYIAPIREEVKQREKSGRAFIDFPVNRTEIRPNYRNNIRELAKIQTTIDSVRTNPYATITEVTIKGFASPEGGYANNARLAKGRAEALARHTRNLYHFSDSVSFSVDSEPEDWEGLRTLVETSDLPQKEALLAVINDSTLKDLDVREAKLRQVAGNSTYTYLLRNFYPALRHSDYTVRYTIRNFTTQEAKELLYTDPRQLSLEEMYRVAQTYEPGSKEFCEVFEIAVRLYPDDPVCNLNAANTALSRQDAEAARRYLKKAQPGMEKDKAEKALKQLEDFLNNKIQSE